MDGKRRNDDNNKRRRNQNDIVIRSIDRPIFGVPSFHGGNFVAGGYMRANVDDIIDLEQHDYFSLMNALPDG